MERQQNRRSRNPVYDRLKGSRSFVDSVWSDNGLVAVTPDDPFAGTIEGAIKQAEVRMRSPQQRQQEAYAQRQNARSTTQTAAQRLLEGEDAQPEDGQSSDERAAQAKALVSEWDDDDLDAIEEAIADRIVARAARADQPETNASDDEEPLYAHEFTDAAWDSQFEGTEEGEES